MGLHHVCDIRPEVPSTRVLAELVPPPLFAAARFANYSPDPSQPTQSGALAALQAFARAQPAPRAKWWSRKPAPPESRAGVYLDGGFGVGKTHLLAALWHETPGPKVFGTFVELTNLVGLLGFNRAAELLSGMRLVCVDEFELDDPGDTVLMSTLLGRLVASGVRLAASSNTLPDRLGEGRFSAEDFLREIQGLAAHFDVYRIEGQDYRHRGLPVAPPTIAGTEVVARALARSTTGTAWIDSFPAVIAHLRTIHPAHYGALLDGVDRWYLTDVHQLQDQADALRLVVLVDRLYDRDVTVITAGVPVDEVFSAQMRQGGYRKKYSRAISRLVALARAGSQAD